MSVQAFSSMDDQKAFGGVRNLFKIGRDKPPTLQAQTEDDVTTFFIQDEDESFGQAIFDVLDLLHTMNHPQAQLINQCVNSLSATSRHPEKKDLFVKIAMKPRAPLSALEVFGPLLQTCAQFYARLADALSLETPSTLETPQAPFALAKTRADLLRARLYAHMDTKHSDPMLAKSQPNPLPEASPSSAPPEKSAEKTLFQPLLEEAKAPTVSQKKVAGARDGLIAEEATGAAPSQKKAEGARNGLIEALMRAVSELPPPSSSSSSSSSSSAS